MKATKFKAFKAWVCVSSARETDYLPFNTRRRCLDFCNYNERPLRVVIRDARDDEATKLRRENARLRRALRFYSDADAYSVKRIGAGLVVGTVFADRGGIARAALRKGGAK